MLFTSGKFGLKSAHSITKPLKAHGGKKNMSERKKYELEEK